MEECFELCDVRFTFFIRHVLYGMCVNYGIIAIYLEFRHCERTSVPIIGYMPYDTYDVPCMRIAFGSQNMFCFELRKTNNTARDAVASCKTANKHNKCADQYVMILILD